MQSNEQNSGQKYVEFYLKCWKKRNEMCHNEEKQKERMKKWYMNELNRVENSEIKQMRNYAQKFKINEDRCSIETIKAWISNLKKIEKRTEDIPKNDIRRYFGAREMRINCTKIVELGS